jgi:beta-lactamase class D
MRIFLVLIMALALQSACTRNNIREDKSLKAFFDKNGVTGCFALFDNGHNEFTIHNLKRYRDSAYSPASTFKIVNALIGFETGKIINESMVLPFEGKPRAIEQWNRDLRFDSAFKLSAVWYFQEIARRIGRDTMKRFLDSLQYGNMNTGNNIDSFWLNNTLKIRPDEQLGLMKKLYFNQLNTLFTNRSMNKVKDVMLMELTDKYALSYKTGLTYTEAGHPLGWVVGWIEEGSKKKPYFFVLNVESANPQASLRELRLPLLKELLQHLGYLQGKKG